MAYRVGLRTSAVTGGTHSLSAGTPGLRPGLMNSALNGAGV